MYDRALLPPAQLEFVILTDTHYMLDPGGQAVEFENRRLQSARAGHALAKIGALQTPFVVHLGDLVQTFPGRADFAQAVDEAQAQIASFGVDLRLAAGNHDVGDKPDPTMPTEWATPASLAAFHARFGPSWRSWDWEDLHFVILNSQIMNTELPEAGEQARWAEADLAAHAGKRIFLFLHMPPYLHDATEPALGHYDNLAQPGRGWLLDLVCRYGVELMGAAHVHFGFYDELPHTALSHTMPGAGVDAVRYYVVPSPAFTRPGFSELFSSAPPDQQGRNDMPKLGFYLARVQETGTRLHFIRTGGATEPLPNAQSDGQACARQWVLTRHPLDLPGSPLGITLRHPFTRMTEVPVAWPSVIRQPVRNDYPLLLGQELGVRYMRLPLSDLGSQLQRRRLALARKQGMALVASVLWPPEQAGQDAVQASLADAGAQGDEAAPCVDGGVDGVEVQMIGAERPNAACVAWLRELGAMGIAVTLAPLYPDRTVAGKQHSRTQVGYAPGELSEVAAFLAEQGLAGVRALCAPDDVAALQAWVAGQASYGIPNGLAGIDFLVALAGGDDFANAAIAAQALFAVAALPGARLFFDPWMDMDRTMDAALGLIDRRCNPRPAFTVVKMLNSLLYAEAAEPMKSGAVHVEAGGMILQGERGEARMWLLIPNGTVASWKPALDALGLGQENFQGGSTLRCYDLLQGTVQAGVADGLVVGPGEILLLVV